MDEVLPALLPVALVKTAQTLCCLLGDAENTTDHDNLYRNKTPRQKAGAYDVAKLCFPTTTHWRAPSAADRPEQPIMIMRSSSQRVKSGIARVTVVTLAFKTRPEQDLQKALYIMLI